MIDLSKPYPLGLDRRTWPLFVVGFLVAVAILLWLDHPLSMLMTNRNKGVADFFNEVTRWGESDWILYPSAALLAVSAILARLLPQRISKLALIEMIQIYAVIFVGVGLPSLISTLLKRLVGRVRPELFDSAGLFSFHPVINDYGFESWPSGHTTTAFAAAMVLGFLAPRWFGLGLLYAFAVGVSRLVLGAHYPSDVLSGAVLGVVGAYWVRNEFAKRRWGFERTADGRIEQRPVVAVARLVRSFTARRRGNAPVPRRDQP